MTNKELYFHVVKGAQAGSTIDLEGNKSYIVASDFSADIYLKVDKQQKFTFIIKEDKVEFSNLAANLINSDSGDAITPDTAYSLPLFFSIQETIVGISYDAEPMYQPKLDTLASENDSTQNDIFADNFIDDVQKVALTANPLVKKLQEIYQLCSQKAKDYWKSLYTKFGYFLYAIISVIMILVIMMGIFISQLNQEEAQNNNLTHMVKTRHVLQKELLELSTEYSNIKLNQQNGGFVISGILKDRDLLLPLSKKLNMLSHYKISYKLVFFNEIEATILQILAQNNIFNPKVQYQLEDGVGVVMTGLTDNMANIDNAEINIHDKYGDIGQIDTSRIFFTKDIEDFFNKLPDDLKDQLSINKDYQHGIITIEGILPNSKIEYMNAQAAQFNSYYLGVVQIRLNIQDILKGLPFYIKEVYTGEPSWIITDDGTRIYSGGSYKNITVIAIKPDKIVLKGKFDFSLSMDDLMELGPNSTGGVAIINHECGRACIIKQEMQQESQTINKEKQQLQELKAIVATTKNKNLTNDLNDTINNLGQNVKGMEHEFNSYNGKAVKQ